MLVAQFRDNLFCSNTRIHQPYDWRAQQQSSSSVNSICQTGAEEVLNVQGSSYSWSTPPLVLLGLTDDWGRKCLNQVHGWPLPVWRHQKDVYYRDINSLEQEWGKAVVHFGWRDGHECTSVHGWLVVWLVYWWHRSLKKRFADESLHMGDSICESSP